MAGFATVYFDGEPVRAHVRRIYLPFYVVDRDRVLLTFNCSEEELPWSKLAVIQQQIAYRLLACRFLNFHPIIR